MDLHLRWIASSSASCFHAANLMAQDQALSDSELGTDFEPAIRMLKDQLARFQMNETQFWNHLIPLSSGIESNHELAEVVLRKTVPLAAIQASMPTELANSFKTLEEIYRAKYPRMADELVQRVRPLKEHWEARGPGLLFALKRLVDEELIVESADVILVQPHSGGNGASHLQYNSVRIEALLYNTDQSLSEIFRLGWLLSQLNIDLPKYSELIPRDRLSLVSGYAMLAACFQAAAEVELLEFNKESLQNALQSWCFTKDPANTAETLFNWWQTYLNSDMRFNVALAALDRML